MLLVDADTQETATDFTLQRNQRTEGNAGFTCIKLAAAAVRTETLRLAEKYQDVIIDTGGRDTTSQRAALSVSDVLLAPFQPSSFDLWALEQTTQPTFLISASDRLSSGLPLGMIKIYQLSNQGTSVFPYLSAENGL